MSLDGYNDPASMERRNDERRQGERRIDNDRRHQSRSHEDERRCEIDRRVLENRRN